MRTISRLLVVRGVITSCAPGLHGFLAVCTVCNLCRPPGTYVHVAFYHQGQGVSALAVSGLPAGEGSRDIFQPSATGETINSGTRPYLTALPHCEEGHGCAQPIARIHSGHCQDDKQQ